MSTSSPVIWNTQIEHAIDTQSGWRTPNRTLGAGERAVESDTGFEKVGLTGATTWTGTGYSAPHPQMALADSATSPSGILLTPAGSGSAVVIPSIPVFPASTFLPANYVIQHSGILYYKTASGTTGSTWSSGAGFTAMGAVSSSPLTINPTAVTTGSPTLTAGQQTEVTCSTASLTVNLPTGAASGTFIAVEKTDATVFTVVISGQIRATGTSTLTLYGQHEVVGFVADASGFWWPAWSHKPLSMLDSRYAVQQPALVFPVLGTCGNVASSVVANVVYGRRVIVPRSGTLEDVTFTCTAAATGNYILGVYDTGDSSANNGQRNLLAASNSNAGTAITAATVSWNPALSGMLPGTHLDLAVQCSATPTMAMDAMLSKTASLGAVPSNFLPCTGGASAKLAWSNAPGSMGLPTTIADASCTPSGNALALYARIV